MIEKSILDYMNANASVPCYMERPEKKPSGAYILLEKTGSRRANLITTSTIAVQSYANTLYKAAELNEEAKALMDNLRILPEVSASRLNSDYNFTNTADKQYRYQAVYVVTHY